MTKLKKGLLVLSAGLLLMCGCSSETAESFRVADQGSSLTLKADSSGILRASGKKALEETLNDLDFNNARFIDGTDGLYAMIPVQNGGMRLLNVDADKKIQAAADLDYSSQSDPVMLENTLFVLDTDAPGIEIHTYAAGTLDEKDVLKPQIKLKEDVELVPVSMAGDENYLYVQVMQGKAGADTAENLVYVLDYFGNLSSTITLEKAPKAFYGQMSGSDHGIILPVNYYKDNAFDQAELKTILPDGSALADGSVLLEGQDVERVWTDPDGNFQILAYRKQKGYPGFQYALLDLEKGQETLIEGQEEMGNEAQAPLLVRDKKLILAGPQAIVVYDLGSKSSTVYPVSDNTELEDPKIIAGAIEAKTDDSSQS